MFTPWGYQVDAPLPPLVQIGDFNETTGNAFANDLRALTAVDAASQAIRNVCGWHIAPSMSCTAKITASGKLAKLPANLVTEYESVKEYDRHAGEWVELSIPGDVETRQDGLIRRCCFKNFTDAWDGIEVEYTAGYEYDACPDLAHAVIEIAQSILTLPRGVISESADGVSISYSMQAQSIANSMTEQFRAQMAPYRLVSNHAV